MLGIIFSIIAGIVVSVQSVFNTRVGDKIGLVETTVVVHLVGLIFGLIVTFFLGSGDFKRIGEVNKLYLLGGVFGVIIVYTVMQGINLLGASYSGAIMLVTQLVVASLIDIFGLFGNQKIDFDSSKFLGIIIMIVGIVIFKLKG